MDRRTRLFTALWPAPSLRAAIAAWQGTWEWPRQAAIVKADRLHATLHFLGDVSTSRVPEIRAALALPFEPFDLELGVGSVWPNGVAVIEPLAIPPPLAELHARMRRVVEQLEIPVDERPYRPHVTLARRAHRATPPAVTLARRWRVHDGYVLVQSLPGGAGYEVIARFG